MGSSCKWWKVIHTEMPYVPHRINSGMLSMKYNQHRRGRHTSPEGAAVEVFPAKEQRKCLNLNQRVFSTKIRQLKMSVFWTAWFSAYSFLMLLVACIWSSNSCWVGCCYKAMCWEPDPTRRLFTLAHCLQSMRLKKFTVGKKSCQRKGIKPILAWFLKKTYMLPCVCLPSASHLPNFEAWS